MISNEDNLGRIWTIACYGVDNEMPTCRKPRKGKYTSRDGRTTQMKYYHVYFCYNYDQRRHLEGPITLGKALQGD